MTELEDKQNWHNILRLNLGLITVSRSELPAFEHCKIWCRQTCWLSGEQSLPFGLLVKLNHIVKWEPHWGGGGGGGAELCP